MKRAYIGIFIALAIIVAVALGIIIFVIIFRLTKDLPTIKFVVHQLEFVKKTTDLRMVSSVLNYPMVSIIQKKDFEGPDMYCFRIYLVEKDHTFSVYRNLILTENSKYVTDFRKVFFKKIPIIYVNVLSRILGISYLVICEDGTYAYCKEKISDTKWKDCYINDYLYYSGEFSCNGAYREFIFASISNSAILLSYPSPSFPYLENYTIKIEEAPTLLNFVLEYDRNEFIKEKILEAYSYYMPKVEDCSLYGEIYGVPVVNCKVCYSPTSLFINGVEYNGKIYGIRKGKKFCLNVEGKRVCIYINDETKYFE